MSRFDVFKSGLITAILKAPVSSDVLTIIMTDSEIHLKYVSEKGTESEIHYILFIKFFSSKALAFIVFNGILSSVSLYKICCIFHQFITMYVCF